MQEIVQYGLLGIGTGAIFALMAQGLIVVYRGSGVLNFAQGAVGMVGAYVQWDLGTATVLPFWATAAIGVAVSAAVGAVIHLGVMRPLRHSSGLVQVIATLGVMITLQALVVLRYGSAPQYVAAQLPSGTVSLPGGVTISRERLVLLAIACVVTVVLWLVYRSSRFGLRATAVAENRRAAGALGVSPDVVATLNWALGSALAGLGAILIAPVITLQPSVMTDLVLAALAGALVAAFRSFPVALVASLAIGIASSELKRFGPVAGLDEAVPFLAIVVVLVLRGRSLPIRGDLQPRLPAVGSGTIRWVPVGVLVAAAVVVLAVAGPVWTDAVTILLAVALILLSIVVLTGYAGQLSLGQFALAGFGAWVAGRLAATTDIPMVLAAVVGVAATVVLGVLFALPAVRTRGLNLAVITLGLGSALEVLVFENQNYTGGLSGTRLQAISLFGIDVNSITHPTGYGVLVLVVLVLATLMVANLRRGPSGRRLIATRTNERAAAALGVDVAVAKIAAFAISAGLAATGGILLAFRLTTIDYTVFSHATSIQFAGLALVGGIGSLLGPVVGATMADGSVSQQVLTSISDRTGAYLPLIAGLGILLLVRLNPDGVVLGTRDQLRAVRDRVRPPKPVAPGAPAGPDVPDVPDVRTGPDVPDVPALDLPAAEARSRVPARTLEVTDLTVRYGGTVALDTVSLRLVPGRVTGLIGPNGAGKTSFIDAVTGFTPAAGGRVLLDGVDLTGKRPHARARAGLTRSFQSLELFEDATVLENVQAACDPHSPWLYLGDLLRPRRAPLSAHAREALRHFGLLPVLHEKVESLPYGTRRLVALARAAAASPSVLMLDEPAAGLSDAETRHLRGLVRELAESWGMAVLLVEHDMTFVMTTCDDLVVLDFGRCIAVGPPDEVRRNPAVVASYLGQDTAPAVETTPRVDELTGPTR